MNVTYYSMVEKGKRARNEDAVITLSLGPETFFFAVADGMGGVKGGNIASNLILDKIESSLYNYFHNHSISHLTLKNILNDVFHTAHNSLSDYIKENPEYKGMGTTLTVLLIHQNKYVWGNIGDSRIYINTNHDVCRITKDHNLLEDIEDEGITQNYTPGHNFGNVLTRVIDGGFDNPDIFPVSEPYRTFLNKTTWLLCSDGLIVNKADDYNDYLAKEFLKNDTIKTTSHRLVNNALKEGSTDNISLILVQASPKTEEADKKTIRIRSTRKKHKSAKLLLIALAVLSIAAAGIFAMSYFDIISLREIGGILSKLINKIKNIPGSIFKVYFV